MQFKNYYKRRAVSKPAVKIATSLFLRVKSYQNQLNNIIKAPKIININELALFSVSINPYIPIDINNTPIKVFIIAIINASNLPTDARTFPILIGHNFNIYTYLYIFIHIYTYSQK